jgi:hypothetical protein
LSTVSDRPPLDVLNAQTMDGDRNAELSSAE